MGIMKSFDTSQSSGGSDEIPWYLLSGTYIANIRNVKVTDSKGGKKPVYTITYAPTEESVKASGQNPPTPIDVPDVSSELDTNTERGEAVLFAVLGTPMADGGKVVWGPDGMVQWNGRTDDGAKFGGMIEVTIESKEPQRKRMGDGYWDAKYVVVDVGRPGDAQATADNAAMALVKGKGTTSPVVPGPTTKGGRK